MGVTNHLLTGMLLQVRTLIMIHSDPYRSYFIPYMQQCGSKKSVHKPSFWRSVVQVQYPWSVSCVALPLRHWVKFLEVLLKFGWRWRQLRDINDTPLAKSCQMMWNRISFFSLFCCSFVKYIHTLHYQFWQIFWHSLIYIYIFFFQIPIHVCIHTYIKIFLCVYIYIHIYIDVWLTPPAFWSKWAS